MKNGKGLERGEGSMIQKLIDGNCQSTYTKNKQSAKKSIRYIQHRPGKDEAKIERALFGSDGVMERFEALRMIDQAHKGSAFFRIVISPDPAARGQ